MQKLLHNIVVNKFPGILRMGGSALQNIDYFLFVCLISFKVILFEHYIDASFLERGFGEYLRLGFFDLIFRGDAFALLQGIYMVSLGAVLVVSFWTLFLSSSSRRMALMVMDIVLTFIIFADLIYFRYYNDIISIPVLVQAFQVKSVGDSILNLIQLGDILFIADLIILLPLMLYACSKKKFVDSGECSWKARILKGTAVLLIGCLAIYSSVSIKVEDWGKDFLRVNWWNISVYNATGLLGFHGYDIYRYISEHVLEEEKVSSEEVEETFEWLSEHEKALSKDTPFFGAAEDLNVIVVQAEALQDFVIGRSIMGQEITPNLNMLIKDSMYFNNFYHQTAQGTTSDAELLTQCSLYPLPSGAAYIRYSGNRYDSLPERLRQKGYKTAAFHANDPSFWNRYTIYSNIGFETFYSKEDYTLDEEIGWGLSDRSFFGQSVQKLKGFQQPFYAFLISLSSHHPFNYIGSHKQLDVGAFEGTEQGNYIHCINYLDRALGELVDHLKEEGLWDNSVVIIYGDHDSKLPADNELFSLLGLEVSDFSMSQITGRVPLIIHMPEDRYAGLYNQPAGQVDFAPTLLHLLGIRADNLHMMGRNMLAEDANLVVFRNGSFTNREVFYIPAQDGVFEHGECYLLSTGEKISPEAYKDQYESAVKQLGISDNLITGNLIKK